MTGLRHLLAPSHLPHAVPLQALPQATPQVQAANGVLRHRHSPSGDHAHPSHSATAHLRGAYSFCTILRHCTLHILSWNYRPFWYQFQVFLVAALATGCYFP
ncbi:Protein of unknown function [Gryllus bimaculatus]|nr:Protein of unknown function [Gryllus bimaculatus]